MSEVAWEFEQSLECNAKKSFAWAFWTDVSNWERLEGDAVDYIKINGPFEEGVSGETKMPGHEPRQWNITKLDPGRSATLETPLDGAVFRTELTFDPAPEDQTLISQRMSLLGEKAGDFADGMKIFEVNALQGLIKLAEAIEEAYEAGG